MRVKMNRLIAGLSDLMHRRYRVTVAVADLVWVDLNFDITLSAQCCCGSCEFGRMGCGGGQDVGT